MDPIKVIVENFPANPPSYLQLIPVIIAACALLVSIITTLYTKETFINNQRPYVFASKSGYIDESSHLCLMPERISSNVLNAPANVLVWKISFVLTQGEKETILKEFVFQNQVKYPHSSVLWNFDMGKEEFNKTVITNTAFGTVKRKLTIEYKALSGRRKYQYNLHQEFTDNDWNDTFEDAN